MSSEVVFAWYQRNHLPICSRSVKEQSPAGRSTFHNEVILHLILWMPSLVSHSHLRNWREDESQSFHTYLMSMNYPVR